MMKCEIYAYSTSPHVSQLYTGFSLLAGNGEIDLIQRLSNYSHKGKLMMRDQEAHELHGLFVIVNDQKVLFYDTRDSSRFYYDALEIVDAYFKRSYVHSEIPEHYRSRVFPLGLNYELYAGRFNRYEFPRLFLRKGFLKGTPKKLLKSIAIYTSLYFAPTAANMCARPKPNQEPRVLFMVRAWDPDNEPPGLSVEDREERTRINTTRAQCIGLLKRELGSHFFGGFAHTNYAIANFGDLLLKNGRLFSKKAYVSLLHQHPICVATSGLHGSIGWKMGEYVAFSKSIVSEQLTHSVPCGFEKDRNYLEFDTPEQCVHQTMKLVEDRQARQQMMENNWQYYKMYSAPDKLVLRTLNISADVRVA